MAERWDRDWDRGGRDNDWNRGRHDNDWNRGWGHQGGWDGFNERERKALAKSYRKGRRYNHYYGVNDAWWYPYWNQYLAPVINPIVSMFWPYPVGGIPQVGYNPIPPITYAQPYPGPTIPPIYYP